MLGRLGEQAVGGGDADGLQGRLLPQGCELVCVRQGRKVSGCATGHKRTEKRRSDYYSESYRLKKKAENNVVVDKNEISAENIPNRPVIRSRVTDNDPLSAEKDAATIRGKSKISIKRKDEK